MTITELIEALEIHRAKNPKCRVVVPGYENGWDDIGTVDVRNLIPTIGREEWDGEFEETHDDDCEFAVSLGRGRQ